MIKAVLQRLTGVFIVCSLLASVLGTVVYTTGASADYPGGDCDTNAVIRCGFNSEGELIDDYRANQGGNVHAIFDYFSIKSEADLRGMVKGRVTKTGEIWVGNTKVATGAVTVGRKNMPGSTPILGGQAFMRSPGVSFRSDSLEALVKMNGSTFHHAVIMSCGNPVNAFPVPPPPAPKPPAPKPTPKPVPKPAPKPTPTPEKKPKFEITKDVRVKGQTQWEPEENSAKPGETIEYRITFKNTGETDLANVVLKDVLPTNSVSFTDAPLQGSTGIDKTISDLVDADGINIGTVAKGGVKELRFEVTIGTSVDACQVPLKNVIKAKADTVTEKENDARTKVCKPETPPAVAAAKTPEAPGKLVETGAAGAVGIFSATSFLGVALYRLKDFYARLLG